MFNNCLGVKLSLLPLMGMFSTMLLAQGNILKPCPSPLTEDILHLQVRVRVLETLTKNSEKVGGRVPSAITYAVPYDEPEWMLRLFIPETGKATIILTEATAQIGQANTFQTQEGKYIIDHLTPKLIDIEVKEYRKTLSLKMANKIRKCFKEIIKKASYENDGLHYLVLHCDNYSFSTSALNYGWMCGQTCSPQPNSPMDRFASLSETMKKHALSPHPKHFNKIRQLVKKILSEI